MNPKVIGIIVLIFGLGILLYLYNSGDFSKVSAILPNSSSTAAVSTNTTATTTASSTGSASSSSFWSFLASLFPHSSPQVLGPGNSYLSSGNSGIPPNTYTYTTSSGGDTTSIVTSSIPAYEIPAGYTAAQLSPYFHMVRFGGVGTGEITLDAYEQTNTSSTVDVTGWEIKTNRGGEYVPQAVNIYEPDSANPESDIILPLYTNSYVYMYSNSAPTNMRINACVGYLNDTNQFNPSLPYNCPSINQSQISSFSGQCQNYILSLGGCGTANMSSPEIPRYDYACQEYLENNFTYDACVSNHSHDANFLSATWYVWMGGNPLDPYHDNVVLLDRNGLVVDSYNY